VIKVRAGSNFRICHKVAISGVKKLIRHETELRERDFVISASATYVGGN
jgi:hypothetical protein